MNKKKLVLGSILVLALASTLTYLFSKGDSANQESVFSTMGKKNSSVKKENTSGSNKGQDFKVDPILSKIAKARYDELKVFLSDLSLDRVYRHLNQKPNIIKYRNTSDLYFYCRALTDIFTIDKANYSFKANNFSITNGKKEFFAEFEEYYSYKPFTFNIPYLVNLVEQTAAVGLLYQVKRSERNFTEGKEQDKVLKLPFNYLYLNLPNSHYLTFDGPLLPFKREKSKDNKLVNVYSETFPNVGTLLMLNFSSKDVTSMQKYSPLTMFKDGNQCVIIMANNNENSN